MNLLQHKITEITNLIPQKVPFVMVDSLVFFSEKEVVSEFTVSLQNIFIKDKLFTESGVVENMAQTVALHTGYDFFRRDEQAPVGYIGAIKKANIFRLPKLGETITTKANILQEFLGVTMVSIIVFDAKGAELASAEMKTVIAE
jgi:predicted hotdog family 3-hydroxylacyl-ACP dehydratase